MVSVLEQRQIKDKTFLKIVFFKASLFLNECLNKRIVFNFWDAVIGNFDEMPIVFNMIPNKTIAQKGGKSITIKSYEQEKCHISVILVIIANGSKLAHYFILKAKSNRKTEKELKKDKYFLSEKSFVTCNINAWSTIEIIKDWKIKVWDEYLINGNFVNDDNYGYLIMDRASSHDNTEILNIF